MTKIHVKVPATTANLGPGFDALGLALTLWNEAEFSVAERFSITIKGEGAGKLPRDESNPIVDAAKQVFDLAGEPFPALEIACLNRIPLGSGLGSSSAAMLTGLLGANALLGQPFSNDEILKIATANEGHPDNVAPALLGGLVASTLNGEMVFSRKLPVKALSATVVLPDFDFPTKQARAVLPAQVVRGDAIYNISRAVLVVEALKSGDLALLGEVMSDKLHQPYRLPLIPGAQAAMDAARAAGAAAVALSGAGPSLVAFSSKQEARIGSEMQRAYESAGLSARIFSLKISRKGAQVFYLSN